MARFADFLVTCVEHQNGHIQRLGCHTHQTVKNSLGSKYIKTRQDVVDDIKSGYSYMTMILGADGKYQKGARIHIETISGVDYLQTDRNGRAADNLGNLPSC